MQKFQWNIFFVNDFWPAPSTGCIYRLKKMLWAIVRSSYTKVNLIGPLSFFRFSISDEQLFNERFRLPVEKTPSHPTFSGTKSPPRSFFFFFKASLHSASISPTGPIVFRLIVIKGNINIFIRFVSWLIFSQIENTFHKYYSK